MRKSYIYNMLPSYILFHARRDNNVVISISNKGKHPDKDKLNKMFKKFP
jgi:hypothetical protein